MVAPFQNNQQVYGLGPQIHHIGVSSFTQEMDTNGLVFQDLACNPKKMQTWYHDTDDVSPIFPGLQWFFFLKVAI